VDLTRAIRYRGFALNTIQFDATTRNMFGCEVTRASYHGTPGVGYDEKKALADGHDTGDVFMGKRMIQLEGNIYGRTRAEAYHQALILVERLTPTDAYEENPSNKGFVPLDFYVPTTSTAANMFPSGLMHQMLLARPVAQPVIDWRSDVHGGTDTDALAIGWQAVLEARQPWVLNYDLTQYNIPTTVKSTAFTFRNRGNRPAYLELYVVVPAKFNGTGTGRFRISGAGTRMNIAVPTSQYSQRIRYSQHDKVLSVNEKLRMDLLSFDSGYDHGRLASGDSAFSWVITSAAGKYVGAGSWLRFRDTWA